jgi:iron transport multicopper oxidase
MTVIEADGVETDPLTVDSVQVFAAQRYSVVVTANQGSGNFCEYQMIYLCASWQDSP